jgi:hypothetical protein
MSALVAGFIKGATGRALDNIDERRKMENEEKKTRLLAELQRETAQANALFEENLPSAKLKRQADEQRMRLDAARDARDARKLDFDISNAERDDARADRLTSAQVGYYKRAGSGGGGLDKTAEGTSASAVADALKSRYSKTIEALVTEGVDPLDVDRATIQYIDLVRGDKRIKGTSLETGYLTTLKKLRESAAR